MVYDPGPAVLLGSRYNKHHGKDGKFASADSVAAGGDGAAEEALTGSAAYRSVRTGYTRAGGLRPRPKGLTREELQDGEMSLRQYQTFSGTSQDHLRGRPSTGGSFQAASIKRVMDASPLQQQIVVFRGIRDGKSTFKGMGGRYRDDMTGATLTERGFLSTTSKPKVAQSFATEHRGGGGVVLEIRLPKGTGAVRLGGSGENEILAQSGLRLKIVEDRGDVGGFRHLVAEAQL